MLTRPTSSLTLAGAQLALDAALARAGEIGGAFNIAVTDAGGHLLAFARMDGAFVGSGAIARDKAATVTSFGGLATDDLYAAIEGEPPVRDGISLRDGIAAFAGGVAITVAGQLVGAIGASGGSAAQDKDVATAGAAAITTTDGSA